MPDEVRLWEVTGDKLLEIEKAKLDLEKRIEEWLKRDISILSSDLLVIGTQVPTDYGKFIDLLCMDGSGSLVVVELKRDKTPREVTAQALDYASWVKDLSAERIEGIASGYLGKPLEAAFKARFGDELPEVVNEDHAMVVVGSEIDDSTERIIRYLSDTYGVAINAARFQFFRTQDGRELLARTFTVDPAEVEQRAAQKSTSKRTAVSAEQMEGLAEQAGVGELYRTFVQLMSPFFRVSARKTACAFHAKLPDGLVKVVFGLVPEKSSSERGLRYQVYSKRLAQYASLSEQLIVERLPPHPEPYEYYANAPADLTGWAGYFKHKSEMEALAGLLRGSTTQKASAAS